MNAGFAYNIISGIVVTGKNYKSRATNPDAVFSIAAIDDFDSDVENKIDKT